MGIIDKIRGRPSVRDQAGVLVHALRRAEEHINNCGRTATVSAYDYTFWLGDGSPGNVYGVWFEFVVTTDRGSGEGRIEVLIRLRKDRAGWHLDLGADHQQHLYFNGKEVFPVPSQEKQEPSVTPTGAHGVGYRLGGDNQPSADDWIQGIMPADALALGYQLDDDDQPTVDDWVQITIAEVLPNGSALLNLLHEDDQREAIAVPNLVVTAERDHHVEVRSPVLRQGWLVVRNADDVDSFVWTLPSNFRGRIVVDLMERLRAAPFGPSEN